MPSTTQRKPPKKYKVIVIGQRGNAFVAYDYDDPAVICESALARKNAGLNFAEAHSRRLGFMFVQEEELEKHGLRKPRCSSRIKAA